MFTKIKEKFKRFTFLIPLIIGLVVVYLLVKNVTTNEKNIKDFEILCFCIAGAAVLNAYHYWRISYSKEYQKKIAEIRKLEKGKKWYERRKYALIYPRMNGLMFFSFGFSAFIFSRFIGDGISSDNWNSTTLFWAFCWALFSFILYKLLK